MAKLGDCAAVHCETKVGWLGNAGKRNAGCLLRGTETTTPKDRNSFGSLILFFFAAAKIESEKGTWRDPLKTEKRKHPNMPFIQTHIHDTLNVFKNSM